MPKKWWKEQQQKEKVQPEPKPDVPLKPEPVALSVAINGQELSSMTDDDLRTLAQKAGFADVTTLTSLEQVGRQSVSVNFTVNLGTANRQGLVALLTSRSAYVKP